MIKALIAVRSGSERVLNKNIRPFAGRSLLEHKILQLKRIKAIEGIVVNSNSEEMLTMAKLLGCETVKRDEYYATSKCSMSEVYANMAENFEGDIIVYCNVTNPIIKDSSIEKAIAIYKELNNDAFSVNSVNIIKEFLYLKEKPLNYDPSNQPRSQELPEIKALNFAVNVISKERMIQCKNIVSNNPYFLSISEEESIDIDTPYDFNIAEHLFNKLILNKKCKYF